MIFESYYLQCLSHASYLIVDEKTKRAVVVDPQRDIDQYLARAAELNATIEYALLTHFHADFLAGHLELREKTGARIAMSVHADAEYDFQRLRDGDEIEVGDLRFRALETPGHTPESTSILLFDAERGEQPYAVFTGDTLFVGDVGRPDLMASVGITAEDLAGQMYDSLHNKLMTLPDETLVYPAHGAGSMCGKNLSTETFSTIGIQRKTNPSLQPMTKEEFVATVTAGQPQAPAYFAYDAVLNRRERPTLDRSLAKSLQAVDFETLVAQQREGVQILDTRDMDTFLEGHLEGSVNVGLDGRFATWCGTLLDHDRPILIIAEPGKEREAALRLGRIGFDHVLGYLEGGLPDLGANRSQHTRLAVEEVARVVASDSNTAIVDVRQPGEFADGHIEGAINIPLTRLRQRIEEVPTDREIILICKTGYRSASAASILGDPDRVRDLRGGMDAWFEAKQPTTAPASSTCGS